MTSGKYLTKYLKPKKHIVQIWSATSNKQLSALVEKGFQTIFSTYDTLYLDCGYGNWLVEVIVPELSVIAEVMGINHQLILMSISSEQ